jgi:hypothetical protein
LPTGTERIINISIAFLKKGGSLTCPFFFQQPVQDTKINNHPQTKDNLLFGGIVAFFSRLSGKVRLSYYFGLKKYGADSLQPNILLKIVLLGYARGLISFRKIEQACQENVVFNRLGHWSAIGL